MVTVVLGGVGWGVAFGVFEKRKNSKANFHPNVKKFCIFRFIG
jgi:hypothetical protein